MRACTLLPLGVLLSFVACSSPPPRPPEPPSDPEPTRTAKKKKKTPEPDEDEDEDEKKPAATAAKPAPPPPPPEPALPAVEFAEVEPAAPPGKAVSISVRSPGKNQVILAAKFADTALKIEAPGWAVEPGGKGLHVLIDGHPVRRVDDLKAPLRLGDLPGTKNLAEGQHLLIVLPVYASGESVKPVGKKAPVAVVPFFVGKKTAPRWKEGSPLLVLNTPVSGPASEQGLLLDYYVLNAEIASGKYVVHAAVTGPDLAKGESISSWKPWRVKNPRPGPHTVRVQLFHYEADTIESSSATTVGFRSKQVAGPWAETTRDFVVEAKK
jgi:hypothetical protein